MPRCLDCNREFTSKRQLGGICDDCLDCPVDVEAGPHPDDVMIWANGTTATRSEIERGEYSHMSDDYRPATEEEIAANTASEYEAAQQRIAEEEAYCAFMSANYPDELASCT